LRKNPVWGGNRVGFDLLKLTWWDTLNWKYPEDNWRFGKGT